MVVVADVEHKDQIYIEVVGFEEVVVEKHSNLVNQFSNVYSQADLPAVECC